MQTPVELLWRCAYSKTPVFAQTRLNQWPEDFVTALMDGGYLIRHSENANYINVGDETYEVYETLYVNGKNRFFYNDEYGKHHEVKPKDLALYLVRFTPLANLLHDSLPCRGNIEELVSNLLWKVGAAGQQSREVYLARNWGSEPAVQCIINNIKPGSLIFRLGCNPVSCHFEAEQVYDIADLMEWSENGLFLNAQAVHDNLKDMVAQRPVKSRKKSSIKQEEHRDKVESMLKAWFTVRYNNAKRIRNGDAPLQTFADKVNINFTTQAELAVSTKVPPSSISRMVKYWKKDLLGLGCVYLDLLEAIKKRNADSDFYIDLYNRHSGKLKKMGVEY
jgi:hypothetical protein